MSRSRLPLVACFLLACCHATADPVAPPPASADPGQPQAYTVTATLTVDPKFLATHPGEAVTREEVFSLFIDPRGPAPMVIASRTGTVSRAPLVSSAGKWTITGELILRPGPGPSHPCLGWNEVHYRQLEIVREGNGIRGTIAGGSGFIEGDVLRGVALSGTFVGTPDRAPPVAALEVKKPHPADPMTVRLAEAVPAGTQAFLVAGDGGRRALAGDPVGDGPRGSFTLAQPLGPAAGLRLVFEPALVDLAGNAAAETSLVLDPTPVPLLPEDGFEGPERPFLLGGAIVAGGPGARALYIPAAGAIEAGVASRASLRLRVEPGDTVFRATIKGVFVGDPGPTILLPLAAISPTGATRKLLHVAVNEPFSSENGTAVSAPTPLELPLPPGTEGEVLIDIDRLWSTCGGPSPNITGAYLDDLRVE